MDYVLADILADDINLKRETSAPDEQVSSHLLSNVRP